jgi:hypothetical protein
MRPEFRRIGHEVLKGILDNYSAGDRRSHGFVDPTEVRISRPHPRMGVSRIPTVNIIREYVSGGSAGHTKTTSLPKIFEKF